MFLNVLWILHYTLQGVDRRVVKSCARVSTIISRARHARSTLDDTVLAPRASNVRGNHRRVTDAGEPSATVDLQFPCPGLGLNEGEGGNLSNPIREI